MEYPDATAESILGARDRIIEPIDIPEWGLRCYVRSMTGIERGKYETAVIPKKRNGKRPEASPTHIRMQLLVRALCNKEGEPIFTAVHLAAFSEKSAAPIERLVNAASRLSGLSPEDLEDLEGNSGEPQSDDSGSDSQGISAAPLQSVSSE